MAQQLAAAKRPSRSRNMEVNLVNAQRSGSPTEGGPASPDSQISSSPIQKLEGVWKLEGKTERQDESGCLEMCMEGDGPVLKFGSTVLYIKPEPLSCEESFGGETRFSFEVTDAMSSSMSDDTNESDTCDFDGGADAEFEGQPEDPGAFDVCLKADGSIEGDATAGTFATDEMCFKFTGVKVS